MIVVVIIIGVALLALLGATLLSRRPQTTSASAAVIAGAPDDVMQRVTVAIAGVPRHTLEHTASGVLVVTREYFAAWRILVAIVFFPIGLVARAGRDKKIATVTAATASRSGSPIATELRLQGEASPALRERLSPFITRGSA